MTGQEPAPLQSISIVIPAFREPGLDSIFASFSGVPDVELIFAMAEGDPSTQAPAGATATISTQGRARQMNAGAAAASGDILMFLHADTSISPGSLGMVREALASPSVVAGAYCLRVKGHGWWFRFISAVANIRSRVLGMPFGDQAIFITRRMFWEMGGFDDLPILEDVRLIEKVKKRGRIAIIPAVASTSARRWEAEGRYKTTLRHWGIMAAHMLGAPPERIARWFAR